MQAVAEVVGRQLDFLAGDGELAFVDAVGIAADGGSEVAGAVDGVSILLDVVVAKHNVDEGAILVSCHQRDDASAKVGDAHFHTALVGERVQFYRLAVDGGIKGGRIKARKGLRAEWLPFRFP